MRIMETIILDLDTGIDDALALAAALANAERVNIAGISTTFGNVSTRTSVRNKEHMCPSPSFFPP